MATPRRIFEIEGQLAHQFLEPSVLLLPPVFPLGLPHNVNCLGRTGHKLIASRVALSFADL
ncbi:MAG: hypothetical protein E6K63_04750 [Nitrospirae bacterium]|nr:MAG: hypothetical protein E6K63_04750 [Nitrospirota bacterium]